MHNQREDCLQYLKSRMMSPFLQGRQDHAEKQETRNKYTQQMSSSSKYEGKKTEMDHDG